MICWEARHSPSCRGPDHVVSRVVRGALVVADPDVRLEVGVLDLERLTIEFALKPKGSLRSKTAPSLVIILVFLPSRDFMIRRTA